MPAGMLLGVTASAKRHGTQPWAYLTHLLTKLPGWPAGSDLADLLPDAWARSRGRGGTRPGPTGPPE